MLNTLFRPDLSNIQPIPVSRMDTWSEQVTPSTIATLSERLVVDYGSISALLRRADGAVLDSWSSRDCSLLGVDVEGALAFFTDDWSWNIQVYDLSTGAWLTDTDPDFPRFTLDEDGECVWVLDLDTRHRHRIIEAATANTPQARIA